MAGHSGYLIGSFSTRLFNAADISPPLTFCDPFAHDSSDSLLSARPRVDSFASFSVLESKVSLSIRVRRRLFSGGVHQLRSHSSNSGPKNGSISTPRSRFNRLPASLCCLWSSLLAHNRCGFPGIDVHRSFSCRLTGAFA
jgi:hypothetical protein